MPKENRFVVIQYERAWSFDYFVEPLDRIFEISYVLRYYYLFLISPHIFAFSDRTEVSSDVHYDQPNDFDNFF